MEPRYTGVQMSVQHLLQIFTDVTLADDDTKDTPSCLRKILKIRKLKAKPNCL